MPLDPEKLLDSAVVVEYDATWFDEDPDERPTLRDLPVVKEISCENITSTPR